MTFTTGDLVDLLIEGGWRKGQIILASSNGKSLAVRMEGGIPTMKGVFYDVGEGYFLMLL
jgi:hypothetical protein